MGWVRWVVVVGSLIWTPSLLSLDLGSLDPLKITDILIKGVKSFGDVPEEKEIQIGKDLSAGLLGATPLVDDPVAQNYVNQIGRWLAFQTERPDLPWTFAVIDTDTVNAWSVSVVFCFVTRGLVTNTNNNTIITI